METTILQWGIYWGYMGGCQNYGPFVGSLNIRCYIRMGIQKGTIILTTTHMFLWSRFRCPCIRNVEKSSKLGCVHMSYSLNSLMGGYIGDSIGDYYRGY